MISPSRIETQVGYGNGGAEAARVTARFAREDAERRALLDRLCAEKTRRELVKECKRGHLITGEKPRFRNGRWEIYRFCRKCHSARGVASERRRRAKARAVAAAAKEGA